ncbi:MAG: tRNA pseudouridine(55) synthase TruB [Erysipelotrichaceae bacterium]|nr:tRNA pseudouridine(55) synthase TruB [Erysipelotrichaceae bacterium]
MKNVLYVNKPSGMTSFDVCYRLRKVLGTKKIGHTGTLDPLASGVMIVLFDKATKANQFLVSDNKEYIAKVKFGIETDTLDIDGNVIKESPYSLPNKEKIIEVLKSFIGPGKQVVPMTSAISVNGKRLYQYQREGKEVELPVRDINVYEIELLEMFDDGFSFRSKVSSGTYIRALSRDILKKLDQIGTLESLVRTAVDEITINQCDKLSEIENGNYFVHDLYDLLSSKYPVVQYKNTADIMNGKKIILPIKEDRVLIVHDDEALAVYDRNDDDTYSCTRGLW